MRRSYSGSAQPAKVPSGLGGDVSDLTIVCNDLTNWPDGSGGAPFYVVIDRGNGNEEKILCSSRSGNALTVWTDGLNTGRAADGTIRVAHSANAVIEHCFTATDADEANAHVNASAQVHGLSGTVVGTTDSQTLTNKTLTAPTIAGGTANFDGLQIAGVNPVTVSATQTLTNKTLTSPTITSPVITGGTASNFPPIGTIVAWAGSNPPADGNWLLCNGQAVSTTTYSTLYSVCGTNYNATGGQSAPAAGTFRVPLLNGRVPVGIGDTTLGTNVGDYGGSKTTTATHTHTMKDHTHALKSHTHGLNNHTHSGDTNYVDSGTRYISQETRDNSYNLYNPATGFYSVSGWVTQSSNHRHSFTTGGPDQPYTSTAGPSDNTSNGPSDNTTADSSVAATNGNMQPYTVVSYIIKAL